MEMETTMKSALTILAFLLILPLIVGAQSPAIVVGSRVRVTAPNEGLRKHVTTVENVRGDSIVVAFGGGWRTIALTDVTSLDVSAGRQSRFFADAAIGLGVGSLAGALLGAVSYSECTECFFGPRNRVESAAWGVVLLGAAGLGAGAVVGAFHRPDRWERRELPFRTTIAPSPWGAIALSISRAF